MDLEQVRTDIVAPALHHIGLWSPEAEALVLATGIAESGYTCLRQLGGGPALGFWQMEPDTEADIWTNWLIHRPAVAERVDELKLQIRGLPRAQNLIASPLYGAALCRLKYYRAPGALPAVGDLEDQAAYWKLHYNTPAGKGTAAYFAGKVRDKVSRLTMEVAQ